MEEKKQLPLDGVFPTRQERLGWVRRTFGSRGARTSLRRFSRELGLKDHTFWTWEAEGRDPGIDKLTECFGRLARCEPRKVAVWVYAGGGEVPTSDPRNASASDKPTASVRAIIHDIKTGALDEEVAERALLELITSRKRPCFPGGFLRKPLSSALLARDAIISLDDLPRRAFASMSFMRAGGGEDAA